MTLIHYINIIVTEILSEILSWESGGCVSYINIKSNTAGPDSSVQLAESCHSRGLIVLLSTMLMLNYRLFLVHNPILLATESSDSRYLSSGYEQNTIDLYFGPIVCLILSDKAACLSRLIY